MFQEVPVKSEVNNQPNKKKAFWRTGLSLLTAASFFMGRVSDKIYAESVNNPPQIENHQLIQTGHPFWPPVLVQEWGPIFDEAAAPNHGWPGQPRLEQLQDPNPNRKLKLYDQIERAKGGRGNAFESASRIINYALEVGQQELANPEVNRKKVLSYGFCFETAMWRGVFGPPPLGTRIYEVNGQSFTIDQGTVVALVAAGGTQIAPINRVDIAWTDQGVKLSDAVYHTLNGWVNNPNRRPFIVEAPKPDQYGTWWRVANGVAEDLSTYLADDFNLAPSYFPVAGINTYLEPYPLIPGVAIPDNIKPQIEKWLAENSGGIIDVNIHLIYDIIYNSRPLAMAELIGVDNQGNETLLTAVAWHPRLMRRLQDVDDDPPIPFPGQRPIQRPIP